MEMEDSLHIKPLRMSHVGCISKTMTNVLIKALIKKRQACCTKRKPYLYDS